MPLRKSVIFCSSDCCSAVSATGRGAAMAADGTAASAARTGARKRRRRILVLTGRIRTLLHRILPATPARGGPEIEALHADREPDRGVDVALRDMEAEPIRHKHHPDEEQEGESQHPHAGVAIDES